MSNFKSGSGNLDFGGEDDGEEDAETTERTQAEKRARTEPEASEQRRSPSPDGTSNTGSTTEELSADQEPPRESSGAHPSPKEYPYFVRRSNVGDERDTRLEIHVRDKVAEREATFRNELADLLETNEVSKTDAREFALLAAYRHPERVAALMREEGFDAL
jgi:hypothetical protein